MNVTIGLALLAGLASFLMPCVFSLVPGYASYLGGRSIGVSDLHGQTKSTWISFSHGLAFFTGFIIIFLLLELGSSAVVWQIYVARPFISKILAGIVILYGLQMMGILRIPFLSSDLRPHVNLDHWRGLISSALIGILFSAGWSPCAGRVLGAILTLTMGGQLPVRGFMLLLTYSIGMAIPFLLAASGIGWAASLLRPYGKTLHYIEITMGILLISVGMMLILGLFDIFSQMSPFIDFGL